MIGNGDGSGDIVIGANGGKIDKPWYGDWLQVYTACVATAVLAMIMAKKQKLLEKRRDIHYGISMHEMQQCTQCACT